MSTSTVVPSPRLALSAIEAAQALGISARTLWAMTAPRGPIVAKKIARRSVYPVAALEQFLAEGMTGNSKSNAAARIGGAA